MHIHGCLYTSLHKQKAYKLMSILFNWGIAITPQFLQSQRAANWNCSSQQRKDLFRAQPYCKGQSLLLGKGLLSVQYLYRVKGKYTWLSKEAARWHYIVTLIFTDWHVMTDCMGGKAVIIAFLHLHFEGGDSGTFQNRKVGQMDMVLSSDLVPYFQLWQTQPFREIHSFLEKANSTEFCNLQTEHNPCFLFWVPRFEISMQNGI